MLLDAALAAMTAHQLGADDDPDLFAVGFSSSDVIGHTYGMDSQEQMDEYLRLDLTLGRLLEEIDRRVGLDRVIIGLSADHGAMPLVENLLARGVAARRVRPAEILDPVTRALEARFGAQNGLVARYSAPDFYLDLEAIARRGLGPPRRGGGGREGAPGHRSRREGVHARAAAGRPAQGRSLLRAHAALVLRAAQPARHRPAQGRGSTCPTGRAGRATARPTNTTGTCPSCSSAPPVQAGHVPGRVRPRGHRADAGRAPSPRLSRCRTRSACSPR